MYWIRIPQTQDDLTCIEEREVTVTGKLFETDGKSWINDDVTANICKNIPEGTHSVKIVMGDAVDYYKPADGYTVCDMLNSNKLHIWSKDGLKNWQKPEYYGSHYGGSKAGWPALMLADDTRKYLPFWGHPESSYPGGCCHAGHDETEGDAAWSQPYELWYRAKIVTHQFTETVIHVEDGTHWINDAVVDNWCKKLPEGTTAVKIKMGAATDYFRPIEGYTVCQMLHSNNKYEYSRDGVAWVTPDYYGSHYGGSRSRYPAQVLTSDTRKYLSFWGHPESSHPGGCCHNGHDEAESQAAWRRAYVMYSLSSKTKACNSVIDEEEIADLSDYKGLRIMKNNAAITFGEDEDVALVRKSSSLLQVTSDMQVIGTVAAETFQVGGDSLVDILKSMRLQIEELRNTVEQLRRR
jgi:hypothetical protein